MEKFQSCSCDSGQLSSAVYVKMVICFINCSRFLKDYQILVHSICQYVNFSQKKKHMFKVWQLLALSFHMKCPTIRGFPNNFQFRVKQAPGHLSLAVYGFQCSCQWVSDFEKCTNLFHNFKDSEFSLHSKLRVKFDSWT